MPAMQPPLSDMLARPPCPRCGASTAAAMGLSTLYVSTCAFFEQSPSVSPLVGDAQRDGPPLGDLVHSLVDEA